MPTLLQESEVLLNLDDISRWSQQILPATASRRSPGVHLSGILKKVGMSMGKFKSVGGNLEEDFPFIMAMGMAFENWIVGLEDLSGKDKDGNETAFIWQPGEWERDGVFGTPDGLNELSVLQPDPVNILRAHRVTVPIVEEFKFTTKKPVQFIVSEWYWMSQLCANCYAMGVQHGRLHVCYCQWGQAKYMRYVIKFSRNEMEDFWQNVILPNRESAVPEKGTGQGQAQ